jgi:C1A family cysteine protease
VISRRSAGKIILSGALAPMLCYSGRTVGTPVRSVRLGTPSGIGYSIYRFGWRPDGPVRYALQPETFGLEGLPSAVDLRPQMPDVYDQHMIGSCTSNAVAACVQFLWIKGGMPKTARPSRLFIYYFGRQIENTIATDAGLSIADAISVVMGSGVPQETDWPYDGTAPDSKNQFLPSSRALTPPRQSVLDKAALHRTTAALKLGENPDLLQLKGCLAQGFPFVFGFMIYSSFFDNGQEPPLPLYDFKKVPDAVDTQYGGHATVAVGYQDDAAYSGGGFFICRNSWGYTDIADRPVQDKGHFRMPYAYTQAPPQDGLASDFWSIRASN